MKPQTTDDLIAGLVNDLEPVSRLDQRGGMLRVFIALAVGAAGFALVFGLRDDLLGGKPSEMLLLSSGLFLVLALASSWAVIDMARPAVGMRRDGWGWSALMAAVLPLAALYLVASALMHGAPSGIDMLGLKCMRYGLIWSTITFTVLTLWLRRGAPMLPARAGLLIGVAAGSAGIFAVALECPHNDLVHIGVWHGLTVVLAGLVGRIVVPRLIAW